MFWYYYSTLEKYFGQKYPPKNKYLFASFNNDRRLRLEDKTNDYVDRNIGGQVCSLHEVTQPGYCHGEILHIWAIERKKKFLEN